MNKPIKIKVDVTKLDKSLFFHANSGAIYADLVAWPVRESKYGETHSIQQNRPKGDRDRKMPFIGSMTMPETGQDDDWGGGQSKTTIRTKEPPKDEEDDLDEIPF